MRLWSTRCGRALMLVANFEFDLNVLRVSNCLKIHRF